MLVGYWVYNPVTKRFVKIDGKVCKSLLERYNRGQVNFREQDLKKLGLCKEVYMDNLDKVNGRPQQVKPQTRIQDIPGQVRRKMIYSRLNKKNTAFLKSASKIFSNIQVEKNSTQKQLETQFDAIFTKLMTLLNIYPIQMYTYGLSDVNKVINIGKALKIFLKNRLTLIF